MYLPLRVTDEDSLCKATLAYIYKGEYIMNKNKRNILYIVIMLFIIALTYGIYRWIHKEEPHKDKPLNTIDSVSSLTVTPKKDDNDLLITHTYKATIDGEVVNVPIRTVSNPIYSSVSNPVSSPDTVSSGNSVSFKQELDLTPLVKDYEKKKNWEIGTGIGVHDNDVYIPISLQRNFSKDKALECIVQVEDKGITGGEVLYKKRF